MAEWKTLKQKIIDVGGNNFIEVNLKQPPEADKMLVGISKGWYTEDKEKRYKTNILFSKDKVDEIIAGIKEMNEEE